MSHRPPVKQSFFLLAVLVLLLAGCAPAPYKTVSTTVQVTFQEDSFTPRQWKVPSGEQIELKLDNSTGTPRSWLLMAHPVEVPLQDADREFIYFEAEAPANTTQSLFFNAPNAPGEYDVLLDPSAEAEDGWVGKLIVYQTSFLKETGHFPAP